MERQEGYYWVNYGSLFEVAEWINGHWLIIGSETNFSDTDFEFINENRIKAPGKLSD